MQLLLHIPDTLVKRFHQAVPVRKRSAFIQQLLEQALPDENEALYQAALAVEQDKALQADMDIWDETIQDGLDGLR
jgi:hypothetical protein